MKKVIIGFLLIFATLLCSCYQDEIYPPIGDNAYISISNRSSTSIYWQLRKVSEAQGESFFVLGSGGNRTLEVSVGEAYVLTYAGLSDNTVEIVGDALVFTQTTTDIQTKNITMDERQKTVFFTGDPSEIVCSI